MWVDKKWYLRQINLFSIAPFENKYNQCISINPIRKEIYSKMYTYLLKINQDDIFLETDH